MINVDAERSDQITDFWRNFLEVEVQSSSVVITWLKPDAEGGVNLAIQTVQDGGKALAARGGRGHELHLDIEVDDLDEAESKVHSLGGSTEVCNRLDSGFEWRVLTDPDGNRFCIFVH